jgi:hypothetical protein
MDELTAVREIRPEAHELRPEVERRARLALRTEVAYERDRAARRTGRLVAYAAVAALALFALGVVLITDDPTDTVRSVGSEPETALEPGPAPRGDQFLYTREVIVETRVDNGDRERFVDERWQSVSGLWPSRESERGRAWMRPGTSQDAVWPPHSYEARDRLLTAPSGLREAALEGIGGPMTGPEADRMAWVSLSMLLYGWHVEPPGLRRAAVEALGDTRGVTITPGETDARGREGIAIAGPYGPPDWRIILDPETYAYLGFRDTFVRDDGVTVTRASALTDYGVADAVGERP